MVNWQCPTIATHTAPESRRILTDSLRCRKLSRRSPPVEISVSGRFVHDVMIESDMQFPALNTAEFCPMIKLDQRKVFTGSTTPPAPGPNIWPQGRFCDTNVCSRKLMWKQVTRRFIQAVWDNVDPYCVLRSEADWCIVRYRNASVSMKIELCSNCRKISCGVHNDVYRTMTTSATTTTTVRLWSFCKNQVRTLTTSK